MEGRTEGCGVRVRETLKKVWKKKRYYGMGEEEGTMYGIQVETDDHG